MLSLRRANCRPLTRRPTWVTIAGAVEDRRLETVQVVVLSVLVGVAGGTFATHRFGYLFWALVGLGIAWLVFWLWLRSFFSSPRIWLSRQARGSRD
jgi:hypothetical protein